MIKANLTDLAPGTAERLIKSQEQIHQLHDLLNVTRMDKQNALVRRLVKKQQDGTLGQPTTESGDTGGGDGEEGGGDDMAEGDKVNFGDTTHNVYTITEPGKSVAEKAAGSLLPIILASALGGGGLGAAAMALPALLKNDPAPVVVPQDTDTDTKYLLEFAEDESKR
jgi:hypothetical protein